MSHRPLRVALLVRTFPAVSETFVLDQLRALRDAGHTVDVYALRPPRQPPEGSDPAGARYLIGDNLPQGRARMRALRRLARGLASPLPLLRIAAAAVRAPHVAIEAVHGLPVLRRGPGTYDVIHAHFGPTGVLALLLRRAVLLRGPLVTTFHGVDVTRYPREHGPAVYAELFRRGELFTANSAFTERRLAELGVPLDRVRRLPVGVDVGAVPFRARSRRPGEPVRLLSVGRLEEVKGIRYGLHAVARLLDRGLDVRYTVVGGGRLEGELRAEARRLGIAGRVRFTGPLPSEAVLREYAENDLFLMPGIVTADGQAEAQGRVLLEAQAAGLPVVATRVGGVPETVGPEAGLLVPPGDPEALARAVEAIAGDPAAAERMGRAGRGHVEAGFDQGAIFARLLEVYEEAIACASGTR